MTGAAANELPGALPEEVRNERQQRFMLTQAKISRLRLKRKIGSVQSVLIDAIEGSQAIARSQADAPEIDGVVRIADGAGLKIGQLLEVRITGASKHDLRAERLS